MTPAEVTTHTGRFAPSPTGPLHFGSLVAALGSYARARSLGARWLLRIDDIDPPRETPGAAQDIRRTLERFGFEWDAEIRQSARLERYRAALADLTARGHLFACRCSRAAIARAARPGPAGHVYPGTCRGRAPGARTDEAWRVETGAQTVAFDDLVRGPQQTALGEVGDFVVRRRDGLVGYHLACAVDDGEGIAEVVRGADLLAGTAPQVFLQLLLGLDTPRYGHLPVALGADGRKLSKQNLAPALDEDRPLAQLLAAWAFLGQPPLAPPDSVTAFWAQALPAWDLARVPREDAPAPAA